MYTLRAVHRLQMIAILWALALGAPSLARAEAERCAEANADTAPPPAQASPDVVAVDLEEPAKVASPKLDPLDTPVPTTWMPSKGKQCHPYKGRRVCEGPRKVPMPHGEAEARAKRLGLGTQKTASRIQREEPPQEWLDLIAIDADTSLHWPVDGGQLWRRFGNVRHRGKKRVHRGIDIGAPYGSKIRSVRSGLVAYSNNKIRGYGNLMMIIHEDATVAFYAHCQANYVFAGQLVKRGQVIGEVGSTGLAYGAHLHFELRRKGQAFNPLNLFDSPIIAPRAQKR